MSSSHESLSAEIEDLEDYLGSVDGGHVVDHHQQTQRTLVHLLLRAKLIFLQGLADLSLAKIPRLE